MSNFDQSIEELRIGYNWAAAGEIKTALAFFHSAFSRLAESIKVFC